MVCHHSVGVKFFRSLLLLVAIMRVLGLGL